MRFSWLQVAVLGFLSTCWLKKLLQEKAGKTGKTNLKDLENVELVRSDAADIKLPTKLDIVFSYAGLHCFHFQNVWNILKCDINERTRLLIQFGGYPRCTYNLSLIILISYPKQLRILRGQLYRSDGLCEISGPKRQCVLRLEGPKKIFSAFD